MSIQFLLFYVLVLVIVILQPYIFYSFSNKQTLGNKTTKVEKK